MLFGMNIFHDKIVQSDEIALKGVQYEYFLKFSYKKKDMDPEANKREILYQHDMGLVRLRRYFRQKAKAQLEANAEPAAIAAE